MFAQVSEGEFFIYTQFLFDGNIICLINEKSLVIIFTTRLFLLSAEGGNRTPTSVSSTDFESVASTSSTTSASKRTA